MSRRLSDNADQASWEWLSDELYAFLEVRAARVGLKYGVDADDLLQDALLDLAVRPAQTTDADPQLIAYRGEQHMVHRAQPEARRQERTEPYEILLGGEESWPV